MNQIITQLGNSCMQCVQDQRNAIMSGFVAHFRLDQNGVIHFSNHSFDLAALTLEAVQTCMYCATSTYLITLTGGIKGQAVDHWEHASR